MQPEVYFRLRLEPILAGITALEAAALANVISGFRDNAFALFCRNLRGLVRLY